MKIDWTKWSAIAEILSAIAILVTLLYLAVQTEQTNELLSAQARSQLLENRSSLSWRVLESPEIAGLIVRLLNKEELSEADQVRVEQMIYRVLKNWQYEFREYEAGNLDLRDLPVDSWRLYFYGEGQVGLPPLHDYLLNGGYDASFVAFMDEYVIQPRAP